MRMIKKLISTISALAIIAALSSTMVVNAATDTTYPVVKPVLTETSTGVYDLAINVDVTGCVTDKGGVASGAKCYGMSFSVSLSDEIFDIETLLGPEEVYDEENDEFSTVYNNLAWGIAKLKKIPEYNSEKKEMKYVLAVLAETDAAGMTKARDVITFKNLKIKDGVETADFDITVNSFGIQIGSAIDDTVTYGYNVTGQYSIPSDNVTKVTFPGNKTEDPIIIEDNGVITADQSGDANDAAVWAWKEVTGNGNAIKVTIDTGAVNAAVKEATFGINAVVESAGPTKVGIVIQYDPAVFTNGVTITDMVLATN